MTIKVNVANFKKVKSASFEIDPVTLLVGENENGKSSIALAVALTTTATPLPKGINKKDAKTLINDGNKSAKCEVLANSVKSEVTWPLSEYKQVGNGKPLYVSEYAAGLKNIFSLGSTDRANFFIELLQANPTYEDLRKTIPLVSEEKIKEMWKAIEETGWDEAHSECKKEENELTGQWKMVTNSSSWNMTKAKDWLPENWDVNLEFEELEKLEVDYANSKKAYEDGLKSQGADEAKIKEAEDLIAKKDDILSQISDHEEIQQKYSKSISENEKALQTLNIDNNSMPCPECGTHLKFLPSEDIFSSGGLEKVEALSDEEISSVKEEFDKLSKDISEIKGKLEVTERQLDRLEKDLSDIEKAETLISENQSSEKIDIEALKSAYELSEQNLDNYNSKTKADSLYTQICDKREIVTALGKSGVRKSVLHEKINEFNKTILNNLSKNAGVETVWIDDDLNIWRGNRPYALLSRSARYIARIIIQIAIAQTDKSELMIIDDIDEINNRERRGKVFAMILSTKIPALVCMAKRPDESAPDLEENDIGKTYAVVDGKLNSYSEYLNQIQQSATG